MKVTAIREDYWENFQIEPADIEFIYNYLLEKETPLSSKELAKALAEDRIRREKVAIERQRSAGGAVYLPKEAYSVGQALVFPALNWKSGEVVKVRPGENPDLGDFQVIQVALEDGESKEFASGIADHKLNQPVDYFRDGFLDLETVLVHYGDDLVEYLEEALENNADFVRIAGRWFPRALLVDINVGHMNLAEAVLDMAAGGPLPTLALLEQVGISVQQNSNLSEFSLALALQEDPRFDEVGPSGEVLWFLNRLEPEGVLKVPACLRYGENDYDRSLLTPEMLELERRLDDELSPVTSKLLSQAEVTIPLIYPHWRSGTLPLSAQIRHLFPTAYEAPRIRFMLVDGDSGEKFAGWVVRSHRYVYGLGDWYRAKGVIPGSLIQVRAGKAGEVVVRCESRRSAREWIKTVLVGSDGGIVFALLKQGVNTQFDERMTIAIPNPEELENVWQQNQKEHVPFERTLVNTVRELAKLNPQSHVHASELYAAVNVIRRCPPGPILAMLASRPWFVHVGDLHYRFNDSERNAA